MAGPAVAVLDRSGFCEAVAHRCGTPEAIGPHFSPKVDRPSLWMYDDGRFSFEEHPNRVEVNMSNPEEAQALKVPWQQIA